MVLSDPAWSPLLLLHFKSICNTDSSNTCLKSQEGGETMIVVETRSWKDYSRLSKAFEMLT